MIYKEFMTFSGMFDRGKVFFHCLKLGNTHVDTRIVIELYDVTSMTEDSRRWVSLWPLTKKNAASSYLRRIIVYSMYGVSSTSLGPPLKSFHYYLDCFNVGSNSIRS